MYQKKVYNFAQQTFGTLKYPVTINAKESDIHMHNISAVLKASSYLI